MAHTVKVENTFSGPMDLLLYLVKRDEIDIHDIPVAHLTREYLAEINRMEFVDVDAGGDFVAMASLLTEIKSRLLLPPIENTEDGEDEESYDPREGLVQALLEYKRFKEVATELESMAEVHGERFSRNAPIPEFPAIVRERSEDLGALDLFSAFQIIARKYLNEKAPREIVSDEIPTEVRIAQIEQVVEQRGRAEFTGLLSDNPTHGEMVGFFIAILELIRLKRVVAQQSVDFSEIYLIRPEIYLKEMAGKESEPLAKEEPVAPFVADQDRVWENIHWLSGRCARFFLSFARNLHTKGSDFCLMPFFLALHKEERKPAGMGWANGNTFSLFPRIGGDKPAKFIWSNSAKAAGANCQQQGAEQNPPEASNEKTIEQVTKPQQRVVAVSPKRRMPLVLNNCIGKTVAIPQKSYQGTGASGVIFSLCLPARKLPGTVQKPLSKGVSEIFPSLSRSSTPVNIVKVSIKDVAVPEEDETQQSVAQDRVERVVQVKTVGHVKQSCPRSFVVSRKHRVSLILNDCVRNTKKNFAADALLTLPGVKKFSLCLTGKQKHVAGSMPSRPQFAEIFKEISCSIRKQKSSVLQNRETISVERTCGCVTDKIEAGRIKTSEGRKCQLKLKDVFGISSREAMLCVCGDRVVSRLELFPRFDNTVCTCAERNGGDSRWFLSVVFSVQGSLQTKKPLRPYFASFLTLGKQVTCQPKRMKNNADTSVKSLARENACVAQSFPDRRMVDQVVDNAVGKTARKRVRSVASILTVVGGRKVSTVHAQGQSARSVGFPQAVVTSKLKTNASTPVRGKGVKFL